MSETNSADINEILAKPGKEWTPEERKIVHQNMKKSGRQALKQIRDTLRE